MRRTALITGLAVAGLALLALAIDGWIATSQPALEPGAAEGVLYTTDSDGARHETRLVVLDDGGQLWLQSGHHFRGWYHRLVAHPEVELLRAGELRAYRAVPDDSEEARARVEALLIERTGLLRFYAIRTFLLFAEIKPVRLVPRAQEVEPG